MDNHPYYKGSFSIWCDLGAQ